MKTARFFWNGDHYLPLDKEATAVCSIMSRMRLQERDMLVVRSYGYLPMCNGAELGRIDAMVRE